MPILSALDGNPTAAVIVPSSFDKVSGSVDITASDYTHVIVDIHGYFESGWPFSYYPLPTACRAVDYAEHGEFDIQPDVVSRNATHL